MSTTLTFYDVAMGVPRKDYNSAVNPWKSRLALNFKAIHYQTKWVPLPDIPRVRPDLGIPACRKFADGSDYYTLPLLIDPSTCRKLGDSFDIAVYLHKQYPNSGGELFPPQSLDFTFKPKTEILVPLSEVNEEDYPQYAHFNANVDAAFTTHVMLMVTGMPFDPETEVEAKAEFARRAGLASWDDFCVGEELHQQLLVSFEKMLKDLATLFTGTEGPFILGEKANYADLIVGAWLRMASRTLSPEDWQLVREWHGSVFGRLHDALEVYAAVDQGV